MHLGDTTHAQAVCGSETKFRPSEHPWSKRLLIHSCLRPLDGVFVEKNPRWVLSHHPSGIRRPPFKMTNVCLKAGLRKADVIEKELHTYPHAWT